MPRLAREKKEAMEEITKDAIFQAAYEILMEGSWHDLTMERLAKRTGIAKGTVYNYFRNKSDVIGFIVLKTSASMRNEILNLDCEKGDPRELLAAVLDILMKDLFSNRLGVSAVGKALEEGGRPFPAEDDPFREIRGRMLFVLERGIEEGVFKKCDPVVAEEGIQSLIRGMAHRIGNGELVGMDEALPAFLNDTILAGLASVRKEECSE